MFDRPMMGTCNTVVTKGRCTRADNLNLSVHFFLALLVQRSAGLKCTDKLHSVRLIMIWYL